MGKKLLTLQQLHQFFSSHRDIKRFDSDETPISVAISGNLIFEDESDGNSDGLLKVKLQSCHTDLNLNGSFISEDVMNASIDSFKNRPILGYIHKVDDEWEFYSHNAHEEDGELVYDEVPVGVIPESCGAVLEYDEEKKKTYVVVDGYIYEEYSKAAEILKRHGECPVSIEICVRKLSYDAKNDYIVIEDFFFMGVTVLGKNRFGDDVMPGMEGANIKIYELINSADSKAIDNSDQFGKEDGTAMDGNFETNENVIVEDADKNDGVVEDMSATEDTVDCPVDETVEDFCDSCAISSEDSEEDIPADDVAETNVDSYSVTINGETKTFEISLNDKIRCLQELVNATYDDAYYGVIAYDGYLVMIEYWGEKCYRQSYESSNDVYSLTGDRVEVFATYLTRDEIDSLENLKSSYSELKQYKEDREKEIENAKKNDVLNSEAYTEIFNTDEYKSLKENIDKYSLEDVTKMAKIIFADYKINNPEPTPVATKKVCVDVNQSKPKKSFSTLFKE